MSLFNPMREINLLPPARRKALQRESLLVTLGAFVDSIIMGLSIMTLVVILLSGMSWILSLQAASATSNELSVVVGEYFSLRQEVTKQNSYLASITDLGKKRIIWSEFLHNFNKIVPQGITINSISGRASVGDNNGQPSNAQCSIGGEATNRDVLLAFQNAVRAMPSVGNIVSPLTNILSRLNPTYQMDIVLKPF
jgi:Tfp pilus assembly protein PilN